MVKVTDYISKNVEINYGAPQGSVLGPLLFTAYINNIASCIRETNMQVFADDTLKYKSGKDINKVINILYSFYC